MPRAKNPIPTYRLHKATGQAVVTVPLSDGQSRDIYLGLHNTAKARDEYVRILAVLAANRGTFPSSPSDLTINEALLRYFKFATIWPTATRTIPTFANCRSD